VSYSNITTLLNNKLNKVPEKWQVPVVGLASGRS
jgi:hypothetical protein